jgi:phosphodiesterase/alkaline phosphatase D-like protein
MEVTTTIRWMTTVLVLVGLCACGNGGGSSDAGGATGGTGGTLAPPIADLTGTWTVAESGVSNCPDLATYTNEPFQITIIQSGNSFTVAAPGGNFPGIIDGDKASWSGSYPSGSGRVTLTSMQLIVAATGNAFSGSATWTWADSTSSCSGTSQSINATRLPGAGVPPQSPSALSATPQSASAIALVWNDNSTNEIGFKLERRLANPSAAFAQVALIVTDATSFTDTGLNALTAYEYRLRAYNTAGDSAYSNVFAVTTLAAPVPAPLPPSVLTLTVNSSSSITLRWTDNSANESAFRIERSLSADTSFSEIATVAANVTSFTDTGLAAATHFFYRVRASNSSGNSAYSDTANATTLPLIIAPAAPTNLIATAMSTSRLDLRWTDNSNNETGFKIERSTSATTGFTQIATTAAGVTTFSDTIGLTPATNFFYRVRATNATDGTDSAFSNTANATTLSPPVPPAAPTNLTATAVSSGRIDLGWTDNSSNETGFKIERSTSATTGFVQIGTTTTGVATFSDTTGLTPATTFFYRVRATNATDGTDSAFSNTANATTLSPPPVPPAAPTNLIATAVSSSRIDLRWTDNSNNETGFKIERSTSATTGFTQIAITAAGATTFSDTTGLTPATNFFYRVRATNATDGTDSSFSNTDSARTSSG